MAKEFDVGYRKPPKDTQFRKGQSGNPNGRPKGTKNLKTDLIEELGEIILIREGGKPIRISKQRAIIKSLVSRAVKGDARAADLLLKLIQQSVEKDPSDQTEEDFSADDLDILKEFVKNHIPGGGENADDG